MARNISFKTYTRTPRYVTVEEAFGNGMNVTDNPLQEGYCRSLVNFDFKDGGQSLVPRGGLREEASFRREVEGIPDCRIHHCGTTAEGTNGVLSDTTGPRDYILLVKKTSVVNGSINVNSSIGENGVFVVVDYPTTETLMTPFVYASIPLVSNNILSISPQFDTVDEKVHGMPLELNTPDSLYFTLNGITYIPCTRTTNGVASRGFMRLFFQNVNGAYTAKFEFVSPYDITPREAINYGYNMLQASPYTFTDSVSGAGVILQGILPYRDASFTELLFSAVAGQDIYFRLYYQYPTGDSAKKYRVQWEVQDLASTSYAKVEQTRADSPQYTPGAAISLKFHTNVPVFAIKASLYIDSATDPDQVILLPAYNLQSGAGGASATVQPVKYDLTTATGMGVWNYRALLWGVQNAKSTLFMSDINNPAWFPYPNNIQLFSDEIVACVPFQSDLLVFTKANIHLLSFMSDGMTLIDKVIQQNLQLSTLDRGFVQAVRNMVFFKCGNAYHMIVPNVKSSIGELRLAPVSAPITNLLSDIGSEVLSIIDNMYNVRKTCGAATLALVDCYNYLDGPVIRNAFRFRVSSAMDSSVFFMDYILNYDTDQRAWTTYIQPTPDVRMLLYRPSAADFPLMVLPSNQPDVLSLQFLRRNLDVIPDEIEFITAPVVALLNRQYLDTGFRDLDPQTKKRFREVQFKVNTGGGGSLSFQHEFFVDEDQRISFFYTPEQIDDGTFAINREFLEPGLTVGAGDDPVMNNEWILPLGNTLVTSTLKVRFPVTGKGYAPRMRLLSFNYRPYEYLNQNWVYRMMNTR